MIKRWSTFILLLVLFLTLIGCSTNSGAENPTEETPYQGETLLVYSGAGISKAMDEIAQAFEETYGVSIQLNYAGCAQLLGQMEINKTGDIFVGGSMNDATIAIEKGFTDQCSELVYHIPAIAVPTGNPAGISDLEVMNNEYFVLLGPTGAGKTVILEIISGMVTPDTGQVWINNRDMTRSAPEDRDIGFVYQDYMLFPNMDVQRNIIFPLAIRKKAPEEIAEKLDRMASMLNISGLLRRSPLTLSGGEQQRVALARALINEPKVLLLDEPLSALDPCSKENFQEELMKIHQITGTTTIHITHDLHEASTLADRIGVLHQGNSVEIGEKESLLHKPQTPFTASFLNIKPRFPARN